MKSLLSKVILKLSSTSWVITLPQTVSWEDYEKELNTVKDRSQVMNYRVPFKPSAQKGDRCYLVHKSKVRGWMEIVSVLSHPEGFTCTSTGTSWPPGPYIQRSGPFHYEEGPDMKGFQGIRRYKK